MFYDTGLALHDKIKYGEVCHINCDCGRYVEVWNDVFMEFNKKADGSFESLSQKNVDTGMGMERNAALISWIAKIIPYPDPFLTDLFAGTRHYIQEISGKDYED